MFNDNFLFKISKFFLYLVPFTVIIVSQSTLFPFIVGKYVFFRTMVGLALIFFIWGWVWSKEENKISVRQLAGQFKILKPLVIAISIFVLIFVLAGFSGIDRAASFWSNFERGEGGLQIFFLFIFFILLVLLFQDKESWQRIFIVSIIAALLVISYGVGAASGIKDFVGTDLCQRFMGSLGNAAYVGTYLIFISFYTAYLMTATKSKGNRWLGVFFLLLFFVFLLLTQTRGALLGLAAGILFGLFYLFFVLPAGRANKIVLSLIVLTISLGILGFKFRRQINLMPFCKEQGGNRILDISFTTGNFQTRLLLWKQSIKAFKERPFLGWGPENFSIALEKHYLPQFEVWFDRAHNIFFDYLVQTGILGLLSYLGIFLTFYLEFFKFAFKFQPTIDQQQQIDRKKGRVLSYKSLISDALIFALPIAFLVQGLVLFEVLPIYINLFLFLAFANYKFNEELQIANR